MESFGGAICRESVFAAHYEPKVAVYLRDRRSQALTLQLNGPQTMQNRQSLGFDADKRYKQPISTKVINRIISYHHLNFGRIMLFFGP